MKSSKAIQMQFTSAPKRHYTYIEPPEDDPVTEIIKRGRKRSAEARQSELEAAKAVSATRKVRV